MTEVTLYYKVSKISRTLYNLNKDRVLYIFIPPPLYHYGKGVGPWIPFPVRTVEIRFSI